MNYVGSGGVRGEYLVIEPPHRVVFTWGWESPRELPVGIRDVRPGESTVEITLTPEGGATIVRVRHSGLPTDDARQIHGTWWPVYLERLQIAATGGDPGRDPVAVIYSAR